MVAPIEPDDVIVHAPSAEAPAIVHAKRQQWLMRRRELITASDVAAILGYDLYRKPVDVLLGKIANVEVPETEPMRWGKRLEDAIAHGYIAATRRRVHPEPEYEVAIHPLIPWLGATLDRGVTCDGYTADDPGIPGPCGNAVLGALELKATSDASKWEDDEAPVGYQIQLMVQMAVTNRSWGSLAAFVSLFRPVVWVDRMFDRALFDAFVPRLEEFRYYMLRREWPSDPSWYSHESIKAVWPVDSGETIKLTDPDVLRLVDQWETLAAQESEAKRGKKTIEDILRVKMGAAAIGTLPDGTSLTLKTTHVAAETKPREAHTYRTLRRWRPKGWKPPLALPEPEVSE